MSDDITFCGSPCRRKSCERHPSNIKHHDIPHSFAEFAGTDYCPKVKEGKKLRCTDCLHHDVCVLRKSWNIADTCFSYLDKDEILPKSNSFLDLVRLTKERGIQIHINYCKSIAEYDTLGYYYIDIEKDGYRMVGCFNETDISYGGPTFVLDYLNRMILDLEN